MGATYTRQSSSAIVDGGIIEAADINAEFNQILAAFAVSSGHTHDGTAAYGQGDLPITRESIEGSGFAVALKITDTSTNAPFAIKGFQLEFTPGGRR